MAMTALVFNIFKIRNTTGKTAAEPWEKAKKPPKKAHQKCQPSCSSHIVLNLGWSFVLAFITFNNNWTSHRRVVDPDWLAMLLFTVNEDVLHSKILILNIKDLSHWWCGHLLVRVGLLWVFIQELIMLRNWDTFDILLFLLLLHLIN